MVRISEGYQVCPNVLANIWHVESHQETGDGARGRQDYCAKGTEELKWPPGV